jgi:hypothetical protein
MFSCVLIPFDSLAPLGRSGQAPFDSLAPLGRSLQVTPAWMRHALHRYRRLFLRFFSQAFK